jgi:hypothetical protein
MQKQPGELYIKLNEIITSMKDKLHENEFNEPYVAFVDLITWICLKTQGGISEVPLTTEDPFQHDNITIFYAPSLTRKIIMLPNEATIAKSW